MANIQLFTGVSAIVAAPTTTDAGVITSGSDNASGVDNANQLRALVNNTSAAAPDTITIRLWGRSNEMGVQDGTQVFVWYPIGVAATGGATNLNKGTINGGLAIDVNGAASNSASHSEIISDVRHFQSFFAEVVAVTGTWDMALVTRDPGNQGQGRTN